MTQWNGSTFDELVNRVQRVETKAAIEQAIAELGEHAEIFELLARAKEIREGK